MTMTEERWNRAMKVLLVNGSPHQKGCTYTALAEVAEALHNEGIETDIYWIGNQPEGGRRSCGCTVTRSGRKKNIDQLYQIKTKRRLVSASLLFNGVFRQIQMWGAVLTCQ